MRIFAGGIATETNTFSPIPTELCHFAIQRGSDSARGRIAHPSLDLSQTWGAQARARCYEFVFSLNAWAEPSGPTTRVAFEALRNEVLAALEEALPVDIVLLMMHGAMIAEGYGDCERHILECVRARVGPHAVIGVELDLHCNLSREKLAHADIVVTFKEYPHVDIDAGGREVFDLCVATTLGRITPKMGLFDCRIIGLYPTSRQPLRRIVDAMGAREGRDGVLSISFAHGFPFADIPHLSAKVLAITNGQQALADGVAEQIGREIYEVRAKIGFDSISQSIEDALGKAIAATIGPVVVADQSDNVGAGAPGDSTHALRWLVEHGVQNAAVAIVYDPAAVAAAAEVGVGARIKLSLGGKLGPQSGTPLDIEATVLSLSANYVHQFPQQNAPPSLHRSGDVAGLHADGIDIIVSSERCPCFSPSIFSDLGIEPRDKHLLVVKSYQHFYGAFAPIAADIIYMAGPGAVPPNPRLIPYTRLNRDSLYPWNADPLAH